MNPEQTKKETQLVEVLDASTQQVALSAKDETIISQSLDLDYMIDPITRKPIHKIKGIRDWDSIACLIIGKMNLMLYGANRVYVYKEDGHYRTAGDDLITVIRMFITSMLPSIKPQHTSQIAQAVLDRVPEYNPTLNPSYIYYANGYYDTMNGKFTKEETPMYNHRRIKWDFLEPNEIKTTYKDAYKEYTKFLQEVSEGDTDVIMQIQQMIGASLLPTKQFRKAWFMIGEGGNGKSSLMNMINRVHGSEKISSVALENLTGARAPFNCYALVDKTANTIDDLSSISMKENGVLKTIISGDQLTAEIKGGKQFSFYNEATLIAAGNSLPNINDKGNSTAILDRMIFIPLRHKFKISTAGVQRARRLSEDDIIKVIATTVAYAVHSAQVKGLVISERSSITAEVFETETDSVKYWLSSTDDFITELNSVGFMVADEAYKSYKEYILESGQKPLGKITFNSGLSKHVPVEKKQKRMSSGVDVGKKKYVYEYIDASKKIDAEDLPWAN